MAGAVRLENVENYLKKQGSQVRFLISTANKRTTNNHWQDTYVTHAKGLIVTPQKQSNVAEDLYGTKYPFSSFMAGFLYTLSNMDRDGFIPLFYNPANIDKVQLVAERASCELARGGVRVATSEWKLSDYPYLSLYTPYKDGKPQHFKSCRGEVADGYDLKIANELAWQASELGISVPWDNPATFLPYLKTLVQFKADSRYETDVQIVPTTRALFYNYAILLKRI